MSEAFFSGLKTTASDLLNQFGQTATLEIETGSTYSSATQVNTPTYTSYLVFCYVANYGGSVSPTGELVQSSDKKLIISGARVAPDTSSRLTVGGVVYRIESVQAVAGKAIDVIYIARGVS